MRIKCCSSSCNSRTQTDKWQCELKLRERAGESAPLSHSLYLSFSLSLTLSLSLSLSASLAAEAWKSRKLLHEIKMSLFLLIFAVWPICSPYCSGVSLTCSWWFCRCGIDAVVWLSLDYPWQWLICHRRSCRLSVDLRIKDWGIRFTMKARYTFHFNWVWFNRSTVPLTVLHGAHNFQIAYGLTFGQHIDLLDDHRCDLFRRVRWLGIYGLNDFTMIWLNKATTKI